MLHHLSHDGHGFEPCISVCMRTQVPIQLVSAAMLVWCAGWAQERLAAADVGAITGLFFVLVLLAATQDIAVDGWALTLLSRKHIGWVSLHLPVSP